MAFKNSVDDPISSRSQDSLGRWRFAQETLDLLEKLPRQSSARIGIYGGWGSGKTSTLQLLRLQARLSKKWEILSFDPWKYRSSEELWEGFSQALAGSLEIRKRGKLSRRSILRDYFSRFSKALGRIFSAVSKDKSEDIQLLLRQTASKQIQLKKEKLEADLTEALDGRRLLIVIDDLDRTSPDLVPTLLLNLRDILNLKHCFYILAFDPKAVGLALAKTNPAWEDGYAFLEKIIEFPRWLPTPNAPQWREFIQCEIQKLGSCIDEEALFKIHAYFPENPRNLKQWLRHLGGLKEKIARFSSEEFLLSTLYLAQLFRLEFPSAPDLILKSAALKKDILSGPHSPQIKREDAFCKDLFHSITQEKKKRLEFLYSGLKSNFSLGDNNHLSFYFFFPEQDIFLTAQETQQLLYLWDQNPSEAKEHLEKIFLQSPTKSSYLLRRLLEYRERIFALAAAQEKILDEERVLQDEKPATAILEFLIQDKKAFAGENPLLSGSDFAQSVRHFRRWASFVHHAAYKKIRRKEERLLEEMVQSGLAQSSAFLSALYKSKEKLPSTWMEFEQKLQGIEAQLKKETAKALLKKFEQAEGVSKLWKAPDRYPFLEQLFHPESEFHSNRAYLEDLKNIAEQAPLHASIQENFHQALQMIEHYLINPTKEFPREWFLLLAKKADFIRLLWMAGVATPLNSRMLVASKQVRRTFAKELAPETHLPLPRWWREMLEKKQ